MAGAKVRTSFSTSGPFFAHDPAKTFMGNAHDMMLDIASIGAAEVTALLAAGNSSRQEISRLGGHVSSYVVGELRRRPTGRAYMATVFVVNRGLSTEEGKSLMAAASRVEGKTHAFRKVKGRISRSRAVNMTELLKGLR